MAGMSFGTAQSAGAIANEILAVTAAVVALNKATAGGNAQLDSIVVNLGGQKLDILAGVTLDGGASSMVLNNIWSAYQTLLTQYNAALAALVVT